MKKMSELYIGERKIENIIITAPLAGITDKVFRKILKEMGAGLCFTEMVCAKALLYQNKKTHAIMDISGEEDCCGIQLFGSDPAEMAEAAKMAAAQGTSVIDINMGCPVPKVVNNHEGADLLRDIPRALKIAEAVVTAVDIPVTVKLRKGFDGENAGLKLAAFLPETGVKAITVHGRDRAAFYSGKADWNAIKEVKGGSSIPVIGNGDIFTPQDALDMLTYTGCDGIMIARGMLGNPWLIRDIAAALAGKPLPPPPSANRRIAMAVRHLEDSCKLYGDWLGIRYMRKFLGWYLKGFRDAAKSRAKINSLTDKEEIKEFLWELAANDENCGHWDPAVIPEI
ncbi:MAG: tRNA dihydrouridine synthase DusB [Bacillota bacterium]|nr:tRNA dihydrouridine synthase DusB [Bacillota bacterium]